MAVGLHGKNMYLNETIKELKNTYADFKNTNESILKTKKFSPTFYNNISFKIFDELLQLLEESLFASNEIKLEENLILIVITDLQIKISMHYFTISENNHFSDKLNAIQINKIEKKKIDLKKVIYPFYENLILGKKIKNNKVNVGCINPTTFNWIDLGKNLKKENINLCKIDLNQKFYFSNYDLQKNMLEKKIIEIHEKICSILNLNSKNFEKFNISNYLKSLKFISTNKSDISNPKYDLIVSGSMGNSPYTRAIFINNMQKNIPCILLHHGASYYMYEEPFYDLYEGLIADTKIVYGDIKKLNNLNLLGPKRNLTGKKIHFSSRTDKQIKKLYEKDFKSEILLNNLDNLKISYLSSEFTTVRYGPFRDVHPLIYLNWQKELFSWLREKTGNLTQVKLHPKRKTRLYDPEEDINITDDKNKIFEDTDVIVLDYPTTSFAHAAASSKPLLFFDIGLRNMSENALKIIKNRFYYSKTNILNPKPGLDLMLSDLGRKCSNEYTETFSKSPNIGSEIEITKECIIENIVQRR